MKIAIVGCPGSGKSTLGLKLHMLLGVPLYYLDQYQWQAGWQKTDELAFKKIHNQLCEQPAWIIEGCATRLLEKRVQEATVVIFLDIPRRICFYRVFKRAWQQFGQVRDSSAQGCPERFPRFAFLRYIWYFSSLQKPKILSLLKTSREQKHMIAKNTTQIEKIIHMLTSNKGNNR